MRLRTILIYAGYVFVFFLGLYFFTLFTLPDAQVAGYLSERFLKPNDINVSYKGSGISVWMTLVLQDADLELSNGEHRFHFDRIEMGISPLQYLFGSRPFVVKAKGYGGDIKIVAGVKKENISLAVDTDNLDLSLVDILKDKTGLNLKGSFDLLLRVDLNKKRSNKSNGSISLSLEASEIKGGKIMGFEIPPVDIGDIRSKVDIKDGKFKVSDFKGKGKDIEVRLAGEGQILQPLGRSSLNLNLRLKPSQRFIDKNDKIKTILFGIASSLDKEGFYNFSLKGTFSDPLFLPEKKN